MPSVLFDDTVSDEGSANWSGSTQVLYVACDMLALPNRAAPNPYGVTDQLTRLGWFALGDEFDIGDGTFEFWRDYHFFNFTRNLWTPEPTGIVDGSPLYSVASRIRWFIFPGGIAHLHVFG